MDRIGKSLSLLLILIISLTIVETSSAQTIPKPSVPEFTLKYIEHPYDIPPTYGIDQYTGKTIVIKEGYHVQNKSIEVVVKNQPFDYSSQYLLFYNIRVKGHFGQEWSSLYNDKNYSFSAPYPKNHLQATKNSQYTVATVPVDQYPDDSYLDFQVEAVIMYEGQVRVYRDLYDFRGSLEQGYVVAEKSEWSNTQTINLGDGSVSVTTSPTPNPTPTPSVPEFSWLTILPLFIFLLSIAVIARFRKIQGITQR